MQRASVWVLNALVVAFITIAAVTQLYHEASASCRTLSAKLASAEIALQKERTWSATLLQERDRAKTELNTCTKETLSNVSLASIFREMGTDKAHRHGYFRFYDPLFLPIRDAAITLLEIGADHGASINSWSAFFRHRDTRLYGLAYGVNASHHHDDRVVIVSGDQNNCTVLHNLAVRASKRFDVVIDDGSHHPDHQLRSFLTLFPYVPPGGIYVIEDVETSYWDAPGASIYGYLLNGLGVGAVLSIVERAKLLVEVLNQRFMVSAEEYRPDFAVFTREVDPTIESIMFAQNIIVFRKKLNADFDQPVSNAADGTALKKFLMSPRVAQLIERSLPLRCNHSTQGR